MDRHTAFSLLLLAMVFLAGFLLAYFTAKPEWSCQVCSFDEADKIVPIINKQYFDVVSKEFENAEEEIDVVMYQMKFYETNNSVRKLEDLFIQKAKEGIKVKIILDQSEWQGKITSLTKENQKTADYLKENGVDVKFDSLKTTTHDKLLIIDDETVVIGSHNWGYSALTRNNEASVMIKDKEIAEYYKNYFDNLWANS